MAEVRVEPLGVRLEVAPDETVAEAAWRQGLHWPTRCWGQAECMLCFTRVLEGETGTEPPDSSESDRMERLMPKRWLTPETRLACRLRIRGPGVVLEKRGVSVAEPGDS